MSSRRGPSWLVQLSRLSRRHATLSYHLFYLLMPDLEQRQKLIEHLKSNQILAVFHYQPLHISEMGRKLGGRLGDCPVTESTADRLVRLPFYNGMSEADQGRVIEAIQSMR